MSHKIKPEHLRRDAAVYIRQSSPGQVQNNRESYRVQKGLEVRAHQLGWPTKNIKTFEADLGQSASKPMARDDFDSLLRKIQEKQIGIVLSVDVARLARNAIDMSMLIHWCAVHGTLIGDQHQVYDPSTPEDSMVLGIQGVLAVSELHSIRKRLQSALNEKASRAELHHGVPRGYVVVDGKHLRKHPDQRVQQVIQRVLDKFDTCSSVTALLHWTWDQKIELPRPLAEGDGSRIQWISPNYRALMDMLKNPKYAGVYVYPRYQSQTSAPSSDNLVVQRRLSRPDQWTTVKHDQHPAYIKFEKYQVNQAKIAMNAQRSRSSRGAVNRGASLLAGLLVCRCCGHKMQVHYGSRGTVGYGCRNGRRQRDSGVVACFSFNADELERQLSEQVLYAVSPAGAAAAIGAAERIESERTERRASLSDQLTHLRYEADLTRRRLDAVDPAHQLVYATLCKEWEMNLQAVSEQESLLFQFDNVDPPRPTQEQREQLDHLGERLDRVWHDTSTDARLKQHVVRLLIDHVYAELIEDRDEVVLHVKWTSGHHTELCATRRRRAERNPRDNIAMMLETLRKIADDESTSRALNRRGVKTDSGKTWTKARVAAHRRKFNIPPYDPALKLASGWLTQQEAATKLGISPMSLNRLIHQKIVPCEGIPGLPRVILAADIISDAIQAIVNQIRNHPNAPLPTSSSSQTLLF
jgi:DNA invertase Pin-like site-specific DNA recombinase